MAVHHFERRGQFAGAARDDLAAKLTDFIPDPQVDVRVASYKSQAVSVTGEVGAFPESKSTATV